MEFKWMNELLIETKVSPYFFIFITEENTERFI